MADIDFTDFPPALGADVPIVRDRGLPAQATIDRAKAESAWYRKNIVDLSTRTTQVEGQFDETDGTSIAGKVKHLDEVVQDPETGVVHALSQVTGEVSASRGGYGSLSARFEHNDAALYDPNSGILTAFSETIAQVENARGTGTLTEAIEAVASPSGIGLRYGVLGTINSTTGGFVLTGIQQLDGSVTFGLEFTLNSFRLTDPNLPGGSGNIFSYSGGVFRFNVPVKIGETDILAGGSNDAKPLNYVAIGLSPGASGVPSGASTSIVLTTKSVVAFSGVYNFTVTGPAGATATAKFGLFVRVNGTIKITAHTTNAGGEGNNSFNNNLDYNFFGSVVLDPGTYTIDLIAVRQADGASSMFATYNARYYNILIFKGVT